MGCASLVTPYQPQTAGAPLNPDQYKKDVDLCTTVAAAYKPSFDSSSVILGFLEGAGNASGSVVLNPLAPAAGGAGGVLASGTKSLNVFGQAQNNILRNCIHDYTQIDHSAVVINPN